MAINSKVLKGFKTLGNILTKPNNIDNSGGLSSYLVRRRVTPIGALTVAGTVGAVSLTTQGAKAHNQAKLGRVSYSNGMARMTSSFNSGVVPAMHRASGGNYGAFADMAEEVVTARGLGSIDDYGASPALISALYNMGGR